MGLYQKLHHRNWKTMSRKEKLLDYRLQIRLCLGRMKKYKAGQSVQKELDSLSYYMWSPIKFSLDPEHDDDDKHTCAVCSAFLGTHLQDKYPKERNAAAKALIRLHNRIGELIKRDHDDAKAALRVKLGLPPQDDEPTPLSLFEEIFADVINK